MTDSVCPTPNKRGAGECFGPETTNKFLQRHNLTTLVRSHECKSEGYEIVHNGNVSNVGFIFSRAFLVKFPHLIR